VVSLVRIIGRFVASAYFYAFLVVLAGVALPAGAQTTATNEWTWVGGSITGDGAQLGVYGTKSTFAAANVPSGRTGSIGWTDKNGNLWLFGGYGTSVAAYLDDELDDLWEFNPSTNEWAWMGGSYPYMAQPGVYGTLGTPAAGNWPGSRQSAVTWTDSSGNFWLFGGQGYDSEGDWSWLNDLWEFNPSTGYWVWKGGSTTTTNGVGGVAGGVSGVYGTLGTPAAGNIPGGRWGGSGWIDTKGNFWLFGGFGFGANGKIGELNDLWELNPTTNQWAWMGGSSTVPTTSPYQPGGFIGCGNTGDFSCGQPGIYGTLGTPAPGSIPGGRDSAVSWTDKSGNFWLFGGEGFDSVDAWWDLNDLWEFNPSTNEWTWMGGPSTAPGVAFYGTPQTPSAGNVPAVSYGASAWTDNGGNTWLFGGSVTIGDTGGEPNNLWEFDSGTNEWAWMGGGQGSGSGSPVYGTLGVPAAGNIPGGRFDATSWTDSRGNLWVFGGSAAYEQVWIYLNDLWVYSPSAPQPVPSFAVYAPTSSVNVNLGGSATSTVGVKVGDGFDSPVTLSASDLPAGVTVSFSPSSLTGSGTSQMTIDAPAGGGAGDYTINLIGTSGNTVETTPEGLDVIEPTYQLAASPGTLTVVEGSNVTSTITTTVEGGFNSAVALTASGQPAGVTVSFSPSTITGAGTSKMTVSADSSAPVGCCYTFTVSGTSGSVTETTPVGLAVTAAPPNFSIAASPSSLTVTGGSSGSTTVLVTTTSGFDSAVSFACSGLPAGATCGFLPATVTPPATTSTTLTVTTPSRSAALHRRGLPVVPETALAIAFCWIGWKKRRSWPMLVVLAVSLAGVGLVNGCGSGSSGGGGGGGGGGTQPVTSTVTVTATSGALQQTTTFSLTVD
jgi:N-acetylneuraminic acid mutarotase